MEKHNKNIRTFDIYKMKPRTVENMNKKLLGFEHRWQRKTSSLGFKPIGMGKNRKQIQLSGDNGACDITEPK
jgi:hypothetical protein